MKTKRKADDVDCDSKSFFDTQWPTILAPCVTAESKNKLKCLHSECSHRSFNIPSLLRYHDDFSHKGILHFVCDHVDAESGEKCEKVCEQKRDLTAHKKRHSDIRPYKCCHIDCGKAFKTNPGLAHHQKSHSDVRPCKCTHIGCGKAFKTDPALTQHQKSHSDDRPCKCKHFGCGDAFKGEDGLEKHWLRMHAPDDHPDKIKQLEKFKCEDCDDRFFISGDLTKHRLTNHTAKDDPEYIAYRAKDNAYIRERYATDEEFRTAKLMRDSMRRIFDKAGKEKDSSTELLLGVSFEEAVQHLNNNTRGLKVGDANIHIDHIRPIASFSLKKCKMEILQCSNINNLQLLPGPENLDKSDRFNDADKEAYEPIRKIIAALMPAWLARGECSCGQCT